MKHRNLIRLLALAAALVLAAVPAGGTAQSQPAAQVETLAAQVEALAAQAPHEMPGHLRQFDEREWLRRFYAPRAFAPAWSTANAREALALLGSAGAHGLSPNYYGHGELQRRLERGSRPDAALDVALTRAFLHYLADLRIGRVRSDYHTVLPDTRLKQFDPVQLLSGALAADQLAAAVASSEPRLAFYRRVKDLLAHYRALAAAPHVDLPHAKKLRPGTPWRGAAALRERLALLGDLPGGAADAAEAVYSDELAEGVRRFQARHGLAEDGVIGPETMAALNVPLARRVHQLELALERLRWIPQLRPGPVIAVNLPAFRLWAFHHGSAEADAEQALEMRVIVGEAFKTPTPLFIGSMRHLEFNPYWNVPRSIAVQELIPKMAKDPGYLAENDMEMVSTAGAGGATSAVNGATLGALRAGKLRIRQRPGPQNALGAVKFAMPNPMNIYLHSTAARELFERNRRDLSHGCIRVEKPLELARFVLAGQPEWSDASVEQAMLPGPTRKASLAAPLPVILFYATAMVDREGKALFPRDVYKRDALLEQALRVHAE